jgi:anti-anti-sigma factor
MEIKVTYREGGVPVTVLAPQGELTADSAVPLEAAADAAIDKGAKHIVLDFAAVPYIGSFGIRAINNVLVALHTAADGHTEAELRQTLRAGSKSPRLKLAALNAQSMKVLETSGFDMYLEVYQSVDDAVRSIQEEQVRGGS